MQPTSPSALRTAVRVLVRGTIYVSHCGRCAVRSRTPKINGPTFWRCSPVPQRRRRAAGNGAMDVVWSCGSQTISGAPSLRWLLRRAAAAAVTTVLEQVAAGGLPSVSQQRFNWNSKAPPSEGPLFMLAALSRGLLGRPTRGRSI